MEQDQVIQKMFKEKLIDKPFTTAEFCNLMGKISKEKSKYPEKSFVIHISSCCDNPINKTSTDTIGKLFEQKFRLVIFWLFMIFLGYALYSALIMAVANP